MYWKKLNLWNHQKRAIEKSLNYYNKHNDKAYLIKLPTGTGKTGIIAVLSRLIRKIKNTIIIVPSEALREQTIKNISENFWKIFDIDVKSIKKKDIQTILPSTIKEQLQEWNDKQFVGVLTIQALTDIQ